MLIDFSVKRIPAAVSQPNPVYSLPNDGLGGHSSRYFNKITGYGTVRGLRSS
ncbi:hypothetical protein [Paenibacillus sp. Leaf72]|uniref:hypothetical protein n=1 Tax=Paenibacillus sp. Leaf72 TaxID=1736234 RepID=UPI0012DDCE23|nr:hypothetical protein [Paenibacillus sp. Leaf72]